ncbi:MAG: FecR domain-containing protein [Chitinophagaceae bacterium]|nr:FecR domain-containing protein [Chitinophagaceae bacterium]
MDKQTIRLLIDHYFSGNLEESESDRLLQLIKNDDPLTREVLSELLSEKKYNDEPVDIDQMEKTLREVLSSDKPGKPSKGSGKRIFIQRWWWAAASVALIGLIIVVYLAEKKTDNFLAKTGQQASGNSIEAPQTNIATITLHDGTVLYLDNLEEGQIAESGNTKLVKFGDGNIAYQEQTGNSAGEIQYNTLNNPRGSKIINLKLSDGSRVWLNSESSIRYPVAFVGQDRKVELTGEGYFEVAHDASKPFKVEAGGMEVQVTGTEFNINAYDDQGTIMATLITGSVDVNNNHGKILKLSPGKQAVMQTLDHRLELKNDIDINQVTAWKNGFFSFRNSSLKEVMQQISRWYDVNVMYEGTIQPRQFRGIVSKDSKLGEVLKILEESNVRFEVDGRTLKVRP